jgi:hypothetical protein
LPGFLLNSAEPSVSKTATPADDFILELSNARNSTENSCLRESQITGEPMKFLTLADWTGMVETELFAQTYKSYGLATVRYPVLEVTAIVEPFENGHGFSLRVMRAGKPRVGS